VSSAELPPAVTAVDVKAGRGAKTSVTFTLAEGVSGPEAALETLERLAGADARAGSPVKSTV
jgi:hypothetical protein